MTFQQELTSWFSPNRPTVSELPQIGSTAPQTPKIELTPNRPTIVAFLRHCGCPWAEKTFLNLRDTAKQHKGIDFIAVSHSDQASTDNWLKSLPQAGSEPSNLRIVVDEKLEAYAAWGLGPAGWIHVLSPWQLWNVYKAGRDEGLNVRPTESGSRWQISGWFAVDAKGVVRWGGPAKRADEVPDLEKAVESVEKNEAKL